MKTLFLDANILFAATLSETGASRMIFLLAKKKEVKIMSSHYALNEAKRNLEKKIGKEELPEFWNLCAELTHLHVLTSKELEGQKNFLQKYKTVIIEKDIPILYSAKRLKVDVLVTLDRRDFMSKKMKETKFSFQTLTPGEFLQTP